MRVLLTTDGSEDARAATAWLTHFPLPPGSRLRILSAVNLPPSALDLPTVRDFHASLRQEAGRAAEAARSLLAGRFPEAEVLLPEDDARVAILRAAEEWPAGKPARKSSTRLLRAFRGCSVGPLIWRHPPRLCWQEKEVSKTAITLAATSISAFASTPWARC